MIKQNSYKVTKPFCSQVVNMDVTPQISQKDNTKEMTLRLLHCTKKVDLGKHWLQEIDTIA